MNSLIKSDLYRYEGKQGFFYFLKSFLLFPGFRFTFFLRKAATRRTFSPLRLFYLWMHRHYMFKYGFQIPVSTKIAKGLYLGHFGTIIVNKNTQIGNNCNIMPGVTLGQAYRGALEGSPVIGNCVWIGAGSVVVGNIKVGNNVLIAPNSFVNVDVPDNSLVIGNPAKIIYKEEATAGYMNNLIDT